MAFALSINLTGAVELQETLRDVLLDRPADLTPAWSRILLDFYEIEAETYAAEGAAHGGSPWAGLSARYAAWKAKHYPGMPIGVLTRKTREALTGPGAASILEISPSRLSMGASWTRGRWDIPGLLYTGTRKMPARPPIPPLTGDDKTRWVDIVGDYLLEETIT